MKYYFKCEVCDFDSYEAGRLSDHDTGICPICAEDCGVDEAMTFRPATKEEIERL